MGMAEQGAFPEDADLVLRTTESLIRVRPTELCFYNVERLASHWWLKRMGAKVYLHAYANPSLRAASHGSDSMHNFRFVSVLVTCHMQDADLCASRPVLATRA